MALEDLITFVTQALASLPGSGAAHPYEPVATQPQDLPSVFGGSQSVNAWTVTLTSTTETPLSNIEVLRKHTVTFRLYYEVLDASITEPAARTLSEAAMTALRATHVLRDSHGTVLFELVSPPQRPRFGHTLLGQTILCHFAEHTIDAQERVRYQS